MTLTRIGFVSIPHAFLVLFFCFVSFAIGQLPCPSNSELVRISSDGGYADYGDYCVCLPGYTCRANGTGAFCGAYMQDNRVGFSKNYCPSCQCLCMMVF